MAAIMGVERDALEVLCREAAQGEIVAPANFNSPGQIVIAGHATAVARAMELAKAAGAKRALPLPVSAPFHSALMEPAAIKLEQVLASVVINPFTCPVVGNVEAKAYNNVDQVRTLLVKQVCAPVRWDESVEEMARLGVDNYIEIGPGKVLSGLIKRIAKGAGTQQVDSVASLQNLAG